ncbi:MAG TPA: hypothetical protein V6C84_12115 [Coleofasciculaceae cyanobacterium]
MRVTLQANLCDRIHNFKLRLWIGQQVQSQFFSHRVISCFSPIAHRLNPNLRGLNGEGDRSSANVTTKTFRDCSLSTHPLQPQVQHLCAKPAS